MSGTPFDKAASSIGVTVVTAAPVPDQPEGVALLRLAPGAHEHAPGQDCVACAAAGDVRALLFDLLQQRRSGEVAPFSRVVIDASRLRDPQVVIQRLGAGSPALGLRDFTVARSFHLAQVE